jgi:hypothetical protein
MATIVDNVAPAAEEGLSPKNKGSLADEIQRSLSMDNSLSSIEARADPDAQATVTDFLDFTEYLPSDMIRSLTLIGKLDEKYNEASDVVHNLTTTWGRLPSISVPEERPNPVQLRADISHNLSRAVDSRSFAHAEAIRMSENVNRHYARAKTILSKLQTMLENYPTLEEQQKSPVAVSKSPQLARKPSVRGADGEKVRRPMVPRITVPGEVLAPYDQFQPYSSGTESSSEEDEEEEDLARHRTPGRATPAPRIKVVKPPKTPKPPKSSTARTPKSAAQRAAPAVPAVPLVEPPPNAVIGSADAPWLQLTPWEMARLRKRMKKNAQWTPSDTMISRELNDLGRGIDAYRAAKKKAEDEGKQFDPAPPALAAESDTGNMKTPEGALSAAAIKSDEVQLSNRGMKLNEAKKLKRESLAKQAAEEAEESARRFNETARRLMGPQQPQQSPQPQQAQPPSASKGRTGRANSNGNGAKAGNSKRKRDSVTEADAPKENGTVVPVAQPPLKRTKTETPVPLPQMRASLTAQPLETPVLPPVLTPGGSAVAPLTATPVPVPFPGHDPSKRTVSPALSKESNATITTTVPVKPPAETPIPPPILSPKKSTTPIFPPVREQPRRETRGDAAKKVQQDAEQALQAPAAQPPAQVQADRSSSAAPSNGIRTRSATPADSLKNGRPGSRGKAASQEPQPSAAADRPRRLSTARNTPAPPNPAQQQQTPQAPAQVRNNAERRPPRRPAPGVVSTTTSGGSSAVGRRKKKPSVKKSQKKDAEELEEIDDEGNPIDPEEQRYCVCNGVSYGTMISCDNAVSYPGCTSFSPCSKLTSRRTAPLNGSISAVSG